MPDVHAGKGCTVGTTMTIKDKVVAAEKLSKKERKRLNAPVPIRTSGNISESRNIRK